MTSFDAWLDNLTDHLRARTQPKTRYREVVDSCVAHRGADFCTECGEEVDEDGNTASRFEYCSRNCGCHGPGCPMGGKRIDD